MKGEFRGPGPKQEASTPLAQTHSSGAPSLPLVMTMRLGQVCSVTRCGASWNAAPKIQAYRFIVSTPPAPPHFSDEIVVPGATRSGFVDPGQGFRDGACLVRTADVPGVGR